MAGHYTVDVDTNRHVVRFSMTGFFSMEDAAMFEADRDRALNRLTCGPDTHVTLIDARGMGTQAADVAARFEAIFQNQPLRPRRVAFVLDVGLARLQAKRVSATQPIRFFDDRGDAEAWLLSTDADLPDPR